ncbi:PREDICTED: spindle assembly checkpoint kinase-like [Nicotiana attenuata]|uniref:spindle assembly checkpoint kinase-like n=1 Tax=Nicotiana attenuata TaxID=49451 RepID=UPI00090494DF|nr:PREDICTED: spindle assembly checkpoint kinase-like [Nicotiana attenuata]
MQTINHALQPEMLENWKGKEKKNASVAMTMHQLQCHHDHQLLKNYAISNARNMHLQPPRQQSIHHQYHRAQVASHQSKKRKPRDFIPLSEPISSIFARLNASGIMQPKKGRVFGPSHPLFDPSKYGILRIADFACCVRTVNGKRRSVCVMADYLPPEMMEGDGKEYDKSVNIWSLDVLFYELVYGVPPFGVARTSDIDELAVLRERILKVELEFPPTPKVSQVVKELIYKMLRREPLECLPLEDLVLVLERFYS